MSQDKLNTLFELRASFMEQLELKKPGTYPEWPVKISEKERNKH